LTTKLSADSRALLPRISLVTPSFNQADFLEATLRSVLDQGYPNLDYIVIDGGSKDGSVEILRRYADRLSFWVSEPDGGHADAINKGFARSSGEIMGWINSDDILLPGSLRLVGSLFAAHPQMEWLTSAGTVTEPEGRIVDTLEPMAWTRARFLLTSARFVQQESTFWRRGLWDRAGAGVTEGMLACDFELWSRFFRHARLFRTSGLIGSFRHRPGQRSTHLRERYQSEMRAIQAREWAIEDSQAIAEGPVNVVSELAFDGARLEFVLRESPGSLTAKEQSLVGFDSSFDGRAQLLALAMSFSGIEKPKIASDLFPTLHHVLPRHPDMVWLGSGEAGGLSLAVRSARAQRVRLRIVAAPGPSSGGAAVTLRLARSGGRSEPQVWDEALGSDRFVVWTFDLAEGLNRLALSVTNAAVPGERDGDESRALMAAICEMRLSPDEPGFRDRLLEDAALVAEVLELRGALVEERRVLAESERHRASQSEAIDYLETELEAKKRDNAARLEVVHGLERALEQNEGARRAVMTESERLAAELERTRGILAREAEEAASWLQVLPGLRVRLPGGRLRADRLRRLRDRFRR
jgi:hypothetical protein